MKIEQKKVQERKIGETFYHKGQLLECVQSNSSSCEMCIFNTFCSLECGNRDEDITESCYAGGREDFMFVCFVEKI